MKVESGGIDLIVVDMHLHVARVGHIDDFVSQTVRHGVRRRRLQRRRSDLPRFIRRLGLSLGPYPLHILGKGAELGADLL